MSLKQKYEKHFKIGAAVNIQTIETRKEPLTEHFNSIACENETKPSSVTSDGANYDFPAADKILNFAKENGMAFRLHTLAWHNQTPESFYADKSREEAIETLERHFAEMAEKYAGECCAVDVLNEAINDKEQDGFFRQTPLLAAIGEDYADVLFNSARKYFPAASLVYNDYNECDEVKSQKIFSLVKGMKERGVPIDAIGMQQHNNIYVPDFDTIKRAFELYSKSGVKLQVTELDVSLFRFEDASQLPADVSALLESQAVYYGKLFEIYREYAEILESVTFWGVSDADSWLNGFPFKNRANLPLLFDGENRAKICLERIMDFR